MAKSAHSDVLDGLGGVIKSNCNIMTICSTQPTTRDEAITTYKLADQSMVTGDFTAAADGGGRKLSVAAKSGIAIDASGDAQHIAFCDGTRLLYVTTCTLQALVSGGTVDVPTFDICKVAQPT
jgi:hypothetical protein